ncbi:MAG: serine/threonine protein phosphatase [Desulfobacterales bacterium]|nr:MAG: serine/threonine protein phosphatase [Desulfobacterales bacterium]
MTLPILSISGRTDVGLKRTKNEDSFSVKPELRLCLVADGMGGAAAGELASRIFADTAVELFKKNLGCTEENLPGLVHKCFMEANRRILQHTRQVPEHQGMGCTAELLAFCDTGFVLGHLGDSRTYRARAGNLKQLTRDHSLVQNMVDEGVLTPEEARNHTQRNVILKAVGIEKHLEIDLIKGKGRPGDIFLLCSDGLTDMVDDVLLGEVLSSDISLPRKVEGFIELAKLGGGSDNITVVLCQVR